MTEPPANAALAFMPEGYSTQHGKLMGRHSATEGFLRAMIRHSGVDRHVAYALAPGAGAQFGPMAKSLGATRPAAVIAPQSIAQVAALCSCRGRIWGIWLACGRWHGRSGPFR
jgi:alpha-maltose-1-phosphate synthase